MDKNSKQIPMPDEIKAFLKDSPPLEFKELTEEMREQRAERLGPITMLNATVSDTSDDVFKV